jgi:hypothetical protein
MMYAQPTMVTMLTSRKGMAGGVFLCGTNFETGSKLPEFSRIVVSIWANQYGTKAQSLIRSCNMNSCCSCHGRCPFSASYHLPGCCGTYTQVFCGSPLCQLGLPVHRHM